MTTTPRRCPAVRQRPRPLCRPCCGIALDLGSSRTRAWIAGRGLILDVPTAAFPGGGTVRPSRRAAGLDATATARMLDRLLGHRLPRLARPLVVVVAPVLDGVAYRAGARTAVEVLRPRSVLTVPGARAIALAAGVDLSHPRLVVDVGAQLTEVVLLSDGAVTDARRAALGTADLGTVAPARIGEAVADMVTAMLRQDRTPLTSDALLRGVLLAGGGALRPELVHDLARRLDAPLRPVPAPHTAAVRGAALLLDAAHRHPATTGTVPPPEPAG
ncbi:rod shape-determining protein [Streptomyces sp. DH24]|uniref:rod shape-determining protein n=1 Tax=Streptomyces sp. DH24 TaxID=3040123 RepID=UPI00244202D0|nr:rod shape-determining protein [Streptomyces sp. DH24]MDG9717273.1 rod shape-determining protein [Streptomyces sp. DH24]